MYLVLEYCGGGDLGQYLRRYSRMSEDIARYFLLQLAEGMKEMRVHNLIHVSASPCSVVIFSVVTFKRLKSRRLFEVNSGSRRKAC